MNPLHGLGEHMKVEFYYDIVCPFAYVASTQVEALAAEAGAELVYRPVLLGGVLKGVGAPVVPMDVMNGAKLRLTALDAYRQAELADLAITYPQDHPIRTVNAMRTLIAAAPEHRPALTAALYEAYWVAGQNVSDLDVLQRIAEPFGVDARDASANPKVRQGLFDATARAVSAGVFGVPAVSVDGTLFWGADRLHLVRRALGLRPVSVSAQRGSRTLAFFHDFSSPYSYLASTQVERLAASSGAQLEYVPMLLGALFKAIGTPMVPLFSFSEARQAYQRRDLHDWASWWEVPFLFPSTFPMRTVTALRVAIQEPKATSHLYRAAWAENRDIGDVNVLRAVLSEAEFDADRLLAGAKDPVIKDQLRRNTMRAENAGVCGAPTFQVDSQGLYWGQDRVDMVGRVLGGWDPQRG
jgi:2-hydroxychromene-2-carboxylate isomerase